MPATLRWLLLSIALLCAGPATAGDQDVNQVLPFQANQTGKRLVLTTADGKTFDAYEAGARGAVWGILLVPEPWGFDERLRAWADYLAGLGYRVLAIDTYDHKLPRSPEDAQAMAASLDQAAADAKYRAAIATLKAPGRKLATMGFGLGGLQALRASLAQPNEVRATVMYQASVITDPLILNNLKSPVLGIYAKQDASIPADAIKTFEDAMKRASKSLTVRVVDASPESLTAPGDRYKGALFQAGWKETEVFLKKNERDPPCARCNPKKKRHKIKRRRHR
jgi:carboxymethylenebutenolidase